MRLGSINLKEGKEPTYIIDGVVATKQAMAKLNSADIESVHVNKAETTENGEQASSGTIYITTKNQDK